MHGYVNIQTYKKKQKNYAVQLARDAVNIELKRLGQYITYLIYHNRKRLGFVSFGFRSDKTIYIYIMVLEKHAQRQGYGALVNESIMRYGIKNDSHFRGLSITINKINEPAINAAKKYGFVVTKERKNYLDLIKPVS